MQFVFRNSKVIGSLERGSQFKLYYSYLRAENLRVIYMYNYTTPAFVKKNGDSTISCLRDLVAIEITIIHKGT